MIQFTVKPKQFTRNTLTVKIEGCYGDGDEPFNYEEVHQMTPAEGIEGFESQTLPLEFIQAIQAIDALDGRGPKSVYELDDGALNIVTNEYGDLATIEGVSFTYADNNGQPFDITWETN